MQECGATDFCRRIARLNHRGYRLIESRPLTDINLVTGDEIAHVIRAVAGLLWVLIAAFVVWLLRQPLTAAVSRLATFEAFGVKFALSGGAALDAAIEL